MRSPPAPYADEPATLRDEDALDVDAVAVVVQQTWYRSLHGQTTDPAFQHVGFVVASLDERCRRVAGLG